ncbi:MAG: hemerythrin [Candidatus Margulisiibacteriota bacterium]|nr:MAG: hypothetical protein A2X43_12005 [Candidatus Margulisbacteria bacterium GWD2_39_127]PZM79479.1 MAG: hemerythrin [Candidatus Margulisiibacteriota bacterium]HAR63851.1 hemerythrin [Candidatus Margulisiibacteriota bacterium]HCY36090.1 hemerythrin [Candidatus Margulisiibacteriota bacterium]
MDFIVWNDTYSLNVANINEQHKELFELINNFYRGVDKSINKKTLSKVLAEFLNYTKYHFSTEETFLHKHDYPYYEEHKLVHDKFIMEIVDFQKAFNNDDIQPTIELLKFIKNWLISHIFIMDKQYSTYFQENDMIPG